MISTQHAPSVLLSYIFVALTILLTVYGQIVIKWQVTLAGALPESLPDKLAFLMRLLLNPWILSALLAAFGAALCWMGAMSKLPLSQAYPYMALNFILVTVLAGWLFAEPITWPKLAGLGLIVLGLIVGSFT